MSKWFKIVFITLMILLVVFSIMGDWQVGEALKQGLNLTVYLRLVSICGLFIAVFLAWGYKRGVEASQKYVRANEILAQAEASAERKQKVMDAMEQNLKDAYDAKEQGLDDQINKINTEYQERLKALKEQNLELKETVNKLMATLKRERQNRD